MSQRPTVLPRWATNPGVGFPGAVEPSEGKKDDGFANGEKPAAGHFDFLFQNLADWASYLDEQGYEQGLGAALANPTVRTPDASYAGKITAVSFSLAAGSSGIFYFVGANREIQYSADGGVTWVHQLGTGSTATLNAIASGNNTGGSNVAVGASGEIWCNASGTWTHETQAGAYAGTFYDVAFGDPLGAHMWVAVGSGGEIQTSTNGTTWTHRTPAGGFAGAFHAVTWGNGLWVIVGDNEEIQTSPDGITWTQRNTAGSAGTLGGVAYGNGFYATGSKYSQDGITWLPCFINAGGRIRWLGTAFASWAAGGLGIAVSRSGKSWEFTKAGGFVQGGLYNTGLDFAYAPPAAVTTLRNRCVLVGDTGAVFTSRFV